MNKGLLIVFTGNGKGKTTAALGMALRAFGHNQRVCIIQFIKGDRHTGERKALDRFENLAEVHTLGKGFVCEGSDRTRHRKASVHAWELAKQKIDSQNYRMVILDEITHALQLNFIDEKDVLDHCANRSDDLHIVVTGRNAPPALIETADLVTEMVAVKHPLKRGVRAQAGIEF
jgi:cob(I)alamin adenosyltransferase